MNTLDEYMVGEIYEYLNICDKIKCGKYDTTHNSCEFGYEKYITEMVNYSIKDDKSSNGLMYACKIGDLEMAYMMIEKGANRWNYGLYDACRTGHKELAELMVEKGATDWLLGLFNACLGGNKEIVEMMIARGGKCWNYGLACACRKRYKDIVELMIKKGANECGFCHESMEYHLRK